MRTFIKRPIIIILIIVIAIFIAGSIYFSEPEELSYNFIIAEKGELVQEVNVIGRVKPAESVDLAFETSGKIAGVYAEMGDTIQVGQILAKLENEELEAQSLQMEANLEVEQAKLIEFEKGTRPEEIRVAETKVANSERSLADAEITLENVKDKAAADLQNVYDSALTAAQKAVNIGKNALLTVSGIQADYFTDNNQDSNNLAAEKAEAVFALLGAQEAGRLITE